MAGFGVRLLAWLWLCLVLVAGQDYSEPHEQIDLFLDEEKKDLPMCEGNSICSFLQANNKGLTKLEYCQCQGGYACPNAWDPFDGQSVSQAETDQYKYCGRTPPMKECTSGDEVAYTSYQTYHGDKKVKMRDEIHCVCPFGSTYQDVKYDFMEEGLAEILKISYFCMPLKECNTTEYCKDITEKPGEYIVHPKCICGDTMACPSVPFRHHYSTVIREEDYTITKIKCQAPYKPGFSLANYYLLTKNKRKKLLERLRLQQNVAQPAEPVAAIRPLFSGKR